MPRKAPLKVYRTSIGFHDAYVAAPSRKAALEAWGAANDLFAIGSAEVVTDPELAREPLAAPGTVVKLARGSLEQHLSAAAKSSRPAAPKGKAATSPEKPRKPPKPRPSREALAQAEAALEDVQAEADAEMKAFDEREATLRRERKAAEERHRQAIDKQERQLSRTRASYDDALDRWRAED